jgi:hypothetical protein
LSEEKKKKKKKFSLDLYFDTLTMGLAGPKNKQRISADPNNLHWSNGI